MKNPTTNFPHHQNPPVEKLDTIRKEAHTTYNVNYHIVWIPKYRRHILAEKKIRPILEDIIRGQSESREWQVLAFEMQPDHIHLFISVPPKVSASYVVNILKGNTSRQLRRIFPDLIKKYYLGASLWADGYFVSTAGYISEDKVKRYIDEQEKHARQHEWNTKHLMGKQLKISPPFTPYRERQGFSGSS